jgi:uncharacterized protein (TIGR00369 family)
VAPLKDQPDAAALARLIEEIGLPPFHAVLRPQAVSADAVSRTVVIRLPFRPEFCRAPEEPYFHGGVIAALIDLTGHAAVAVSLGRTAPTIDLRIDYLRPAGGDALLATGRVQRLGRTVATADVEVAGLDGRAVALGRGVFSSRPSS